MRENPCSRDDVCGDLPMLRQDVFKGEDGVVANALELEIFAERQTLQAVDGLTTREVSLAVSIFNMDDPL